MFIITITIKHTFQQSAMSYKTTYHQDENLIKTESNLLLLNDSKSPSDHFYRPFTSQAMLPLMATTPSSPSYSPTTIQGDPSSSTNYPPSFLGDPSSTNYQPPFLGDLSPPHSPPFFDLSKILHSSKCK